MRIRRTGFRAYAYQRAIIRSLIQLADKLAQINNVVEYEYRKCTMHFYIVRYLKKKINDNRRVSENIILQIKLRPFIFFSLSRHYNIILFLNPAELRNCFFFILFPSLLCWSILSHIVIIFFFYKLFAVYLRFAWTEISQRPSPMLYLLCAYCSRNCVYKHYQQARVEYDFLSVFIVMFLNQNYRTIYCLIMEYNILYIIISVFE